MKKTYVAALAIILLGSIQLVSGQTSRPAITGISHISVYSADAAKTDTFYAHDPWKAAKTGSFSTQFPGQRVDFIFTFGVDISKIKEAGIERDRLAKYASDHFPTRVEILGAETL